MCSIKVYLYIVVRIMRHSLFAVRVVVDGLCVCVYHMVVFFMQPTSRITWTKHFTT